MAKSVTSTTWNTNINIACGFILGVVLTGSYLAFTRSPDGTIIDTLGKLATILVAPLTLGLVAFTAILARETRQMWVQNRLPHIVITIEPTRASLLHVELVVENVGAGPAFDLQAAFDPDLGVVDEGRQAMISSYAILRAPTLKPQQRIATFLTNWKGIHPQRTVVTCRCKDAAGVEHEFVNVIDLASYTGLVQLGEDPLQKLASEVDAMRKAIENIASGHRRVEVNTHDADDRAAEQTKRRSELRRFRRESGGGVGSDPSETGL